MKPLSKDEVADTMKKEVPMLLHKRIAELESALDKAIFLGKFLPDTEKHLEGILKKGVSL